MDDKLINFTILDLKRVVEEATKVSGEWNGDESGIEEDRAHCADNIIETAKSLIEHLEEMEELGSSGKL